MTRIAATSASASTLTVTPNDRRGGVAVGDGDHALAVGARGGVGPFLDQELRKRTDEDERVGADHERHVSPSVEPPGREAQQQVDERPQRQAVDQHAQREDPVVVRERQPTEEPEVRDRDEEGSGPVLGPAPQREHARDEERQADRECERQERGLVVLVVAREDERGSDGSEHEPAGRQDDERATSHPNRSDSAFPLSSSLAMKPRAPLCAISPP